MTELTIRQLDDACGAARREYDALALQATNLRRDLCNAEDQMLAAGDRWLAAALAWETAVEREAEAEATRRDYDERWQERARDEQAYEDRKEAQAAK